MLVPPYSACEIIIAWHIWEQAVVAVGGVAPVFDIVTVIPSIVHIPALPRDTATVSSMVLYVADFFSPVFPNGVTILHPL